MHKLRDAPCEAEQNLRDELARLAGDRHVYVLGIGNEDRGDDGAGIEVANRLRERSPLRAYSEHDGLEGIVRDISESDDNALVVFVDAADLKADPGTIKLVMPEDIRPTEITTHRVTVALLAAVLAESGKRSAVICIQPGNTELGAEMTAPVKAAVGSAASALAELMAKDDGRA